VVISPTGHGNFSSESDLAKRGIKTTEDSSKFKRNRLIKFLNKPFMTFSLKKTEFERLPLKQQYAYGF
jgi:hypothetical protein